MAYFLLLILFLRNYQQDTPPNLFFHTPDSSITLQEIEDCRVKLASITDSEKYQQALSEITNKINLVTHDFPSVMKEEITGKTKLLSNAVISVDSGLDAKTSLTDEQEHVEEYSFDESNKEVGSPEEVEVRNDSAMLTVIEKQRKIKCEVNNIKNQNPRVQLESSFQIHKTGLKDLSEALCDALSKINESSLSSDQKKIVDSIQNNIQVLQDSDYEVRLEGLGSILSTFNDGIEALGETIDEIEALLSRMDPIKETVKSQLETEESVNLSMR